MGTGKVRFGAAPRNDETAGNGLKDLLFISNYIFIHFKIRALQD
jgi:hypothetical protein